MQPLGIPRCQQLLPLPGDVAGPKMTTHTGPAPERTRCERLKGECKTRLLGEKGALCCHHASHSVELRLGSSVLTLGWRCLCAGSLTSLPHLRQGAHCISCPKRSVVHVNFNLLRTYLHPTRDRYGGQESALTAVQLGPGQAPAGRPWR